MDSYELSFAKITILQEDIAEVIINEGVEMDMDLVSQYHDFLISHLNSPFSLLINKVNAYTYTFDAQIQIAELKEINAYAVVIYDEIATAGVELLATYPRKKKSIFEMFSNRDEALAWVVSEQAKLSV